MRGGIWDGDRAGSYNQHMAKYKAEDGAEDRHGEMTGAISVNMVFTSLPITAWAVFIGPWVFDDELMPTLISSLAIAVVLPIVCLKPSRKVWAWLSDLADGGGDKN